MASQVAYQVRIEGEFSPGVWTSFGDDLITRDGIRWKRGNANSSPIDTVSVTGTLEFTLRNDARCSGGIGYYSFNHPNCRAGFTFGLPLRVIYTVLGVDYQRWTGTLRVANATPGLYGPQSTQCLGNDAMGNLAESDVREISPMFEQSEDALLHAVFDALPLSAQPLARDFDAGLNNFPVAFHDLGSGTKGIAVSERVVTGAQGRLFVKGDGTMRFINHVNLTLQVPAYTFGVDEAVIEVPNDLGNVFNPFDLVGHPVDFTPAPIVLAEQIGALSLAAGETKEIWLSYTDQDDPNTHIGGRDFIDPLVVTTDTLWNAAADGLGADVTADVVVVLAPFITTVKMTLTNNGAVIAHKQILQMQGTGILDRNPVTVSVYVERAYGSRPIIIDLPYQDDVDFLQQQAIFLNATFRDLADQVRRVIFYPQTSAALMTQAMTLEIAQVINATDPQILPDGAYALISAVELSTDTNGFLVCTLDTAPWIVQVGLLADTLTFSDVLTATSAAPETRIGFAVIGYSEIG